MYKAVIVDDEDIIVTGLSRMLPWSDYGCEVVGAAGDGVAALELVRKIEPDIMFTDIRMPEMDGLSLIAALRSEYPNMQITILSGYPEFEYAQRAIRLGVTNYIIKPSKMAELEDALRCMTQRLNAFKEIGQNEEEFCANQEGDPSREDNPADSAGNFIITNAINYMEQNYAEKLTLSDVADHVYVSHWHLSKLISKNTGQSFNDILNGIRIREAKQLLADPSYRIWEISERVGFMDVTHFSRIFKKIEQCSANEYRNKLGAGQK